MFRQNISVTKTAGELLFDGYEDPLLDLANSLPQIETNAPKVDKFGWFYKVNTYKIIYNWFLIDTDIAKSSLINWIFLLLSQLRSTVSEFLLLCFSEKWID